MHITPITNCQQTSSPVAAVRLELKLRGQVTFAPCLRDFCSHIFKRSFHWLSVVAVKWRVVSLDKPIIFYTFAASGTYCIHQTLNRGVHLHHVPASRVNQIHDNFRSSNPSVPRHTLSSIGQRALSVTQRHRSGILLQIMCFIWHLDLTLLGFS